MADPTHDGLSRRAFLRLGTAAVLAVPLVGSFGGRAAAAPLPPLDGVEVTPRSAWAGGLPVPAGLPQEAPGDVRFLIVHHSASPNGYAAADVPGVLRGFHAFHTGPDKGWPDVAYNFFVDRYGVVWEGREGSLAGPVVPDATGGSQGFSQICCFVGDHTAEPPTEAAQASMTALLAALAERYGLDPAPGRTTTFVSRGSNRWPAGAAVETTTIAGHRDMSLTSCPGDAAYSLVRDVFPAGAAALLAARATPPPPSPEPAPTEPAPATSAPAPATASPQPAASAPPADRGVDPGSVALVGAGVLAAGAAAGAAWHVRHRAPAEEGDAAAGDR